MLESGSSGGAETRKAEAALLMLRLPAARPWPDWGLGYMFQRDRIGLFGPRWWEQNDKGTNSLDADSKPAVCTDCALPLTFAAPRFLTKAERERAQKENERLRELPGAPTYLGAIVIPWAKAHPQRSSGSGSATPRGAGDAIRRSRQLYVESRLRAPA